MRLPGGTDWDGTPAAIAESIAAWVDSVAMEALLAEFGRGPLPAGTLGERLAALEVVSGELWDYRKGLERFEATGELFDPRRSARLTELAATLGLTDHHQPRIFRYDHLLVLGGRMTSMLARAELGAAVLHSGVSAATIAGLASLRPLAGEIIDAEWDDATEADGVDAALRRAFELAEPPVERSGVTEIGQPWWSRSYGRVHSLAAPSSRPGMRAHTGDTLTGWAELVQPEPRDARLLLVTSDLFVPFQHCDAVRLLGLRYGCRIDTIGVRTEPAPYQLLQEVRSAIRSMQSLHEALP